MSIIKLTIRTAPEHWLCVRPYFEETTSALNLSVLPLRKWHGQLCECVCVCCLISSLLKLTNEFQKHTGKVRVGAKELKSRRFSRFPPFQAGMMNSRTENISEGCCSLGWDPPGGLPGAQQLGLVGTPPKRDTHFLPSLPPAPCHQNSWYSVSAPSPERAGLAKLYSHCLHHFCFLPNVRKFYQPGYLFLKRGSHLV